MSLVSALLVPFLLSDELQQNIPEELSLFSLDHPLSLEEFQECLATLELLNHGQLERILVECDKSFSVEGVTIELYCEPFGFSRIVRVCRETPPLA